MGCAVPWKCCNSRRAGAWGRAAPFYLPAEGSPPPETKRAAYVLTAGAEWGPASILVPGYRPPVRAFNLPVYVSPISWVTLGGLLRALEVGSCASGGQSLREMLRASQRFSVAVLNGVSVSTCSAITRIRLVTSSGVNRPKEGGRLRAFTCGSSNSVSDCLPDALI